MDFELQKIRDLISQGETQHAVSEINSILSKSTHRSILNDLIVASNSLKKTHDEYSMQKISFQEYGIENIKVNYKILNILDEIQDLNSKNIGDYVSHDNISWAINRFALTLNKNNIIKVGDPESEQYILNFEIENSLDSISYHKKITYTWSNSIAFKDIIKEKETKRIYIELDFFLTPRRLSFESISNQNKITLKEIFHQNNNHVIILGQPGAGKTTTMKQLSRGVIDKEYFIDQFQSVFVLRLRELNDRSFKSSITEEIFNIIGVSINKRDVFSQRYLIFRKLMINLLDDLNILLILDGFDELNRTNKDQFIADLKEMTLALTNTKIILTSRAGDYTFNIQNTKEFEISPLNDFQIEKFVSNWIEKEDDAIELFRQIKNSPFYDTAIRPLTLSHLCTIYERYRNIPDQPKTIYRKVINLLVEEWDIQRGILRAPMYSRLAVDRKFEFLSNLAFFLTKNYKKTTFDIKEINVAYQSICDNFNLPLNEGAGLMIELETHTGVFIQSQYEKFEFAHKSLQEYLTAEYIVKLPILPLSDDILNIPNEIAIAVSISSNPTIYLSSLVLNRFFELDNEIFYTSFFDRLIIEKPDFITNALSYATLITLSTYFYYKFPGYRQTEKSKLYKYIKNISLIETIVESRKNFLNHYKLIKPKLNFYEQELRELRSEYNNSIPNNDLMKLFQVKPSERFVIIEKTSDIKHDSILKVPRYLIAPKEMIDKAP